LNLRLPMPLTRLAALQLGTLSLQSEERVVRVQRGSGEGQISHRESCASK
jgi:hypothetical protein